MQTLLHRRRPFGDASEGTNDRVGSEDTGDYKILGRLRPKSGHDRLTFQSAKRNYRTGTARRRPGELIGAARIDDHALLLRSVLCYRFSFPIGAANFPRHQSLELIGAEVNQRLSVDKESRGFGHLQGLSISDVLRHDFRHTRTVHVCPGFGDVKPGILDEIPDTLRPGFVMDNPHGL